ncbi:MAG: aminotransferase class V-fold PLP-dependent enzyme [Candidatus Dormibacteraeota bacterium]|nr:aminotransferase class V-fold PLP-dependent enzyme [Candidatus Dormibacteraeota bacterium]
MTPEELRLLVPAARDSAYLNTATYGPAAEPTVAAMAEFLEGWSHGSVRYEVWENIGEECRVLFAELLKASPDDIAIQPYVSTAAGAIAVQLQPGERVVVSEMEFASNLWPWLYQRERGVEVAVVPIRNGRSELAAYEAAIGDRVAIVAVSAFQSSNGWRAPLRALADRARAAGGMLFVDACQGAGGITLDPELDGFDLLVADSYKWLMGPRGAGYMYLSPAARERFRPVAMGWRSAREPLHTYYGTAMDLSETASRFDSSLSWISMVGDRESLRLLNSVGIEAIDAHNMRLAHRFRAGLEELAIETEPFPEAERSPVLAMTLPDPEATIARLADAGVIGALRADGVRLGFHVFNNESDVDRALEALAWVKR